MQVFWKNFACFHKNTEKYIFAVRQHSYLADCTTEIVLSENPDSTMFVVLFSEDVISLSVVLNVSGVESAGKTGMIE